MNKSPDSIIIVGRMSDPFARVSKKLLNDTQLSFKAKGIMAYLLGKPKDWKIQVADLINHSNDGEVAVRSGLRELCELGYASLDRPRNEKGLLIGANYRISDSPIFNNKGNPDAENLNVDEFTEDADSQQTTENQPELGFPNVDNRPLTKIDSTKNEKNNNTANAVESLFPSQQSSHSNGTVEDRPPRSAAPPDGAKKPPSPVKAFIDSWKAKYLEVFGRPYTPDYGKDGALLKRLMAETGYGPEKLMEIAVEAWKHQSFWCKVAPNLSTFASSRFSAIHTEVESWLKGIDPSRPAWAQAKDTKEELSRVREAMQEQFPIPQELLRQERLLSQRLSNLEAAHA